MRRFIVISVVGYLLLVAALVVLLWSARQRTIAGLDSPSGRQAWREWQSAARRQNQLPDATVRRRIAGTDEPPLLVLLRDQFAAVIAVSLVATTALYVFLVVIARGVWIAARGRRQATQLGN